MKLVMFLLSGSQSRSTGAHADAAIRLIRFFARKASRTEMILRAFPIVALFIDALEAIVKNRMADFFRGLRLFRATDQ